MRKAVLCLIFMLLLLPPGPVAADPMTLIIFPLDNATNAEALSWLADGIAVSVSEQVKGGGFRVLNRRERIQLIESLDLPPDAEISRASMMRAGQQAAADLIVLGAFSGSERSLKITVRMLDVKSLKLSGEMTANGPLTALAQMENELAWQILANAGLEKGRNREEFSRKTRKIPNSAYSLYIQSLSAPRKSAQMELLRKAVTAYRNFPVAQFELGRLYFSQGDCVKAQSAFSASSGDETLQAELDFMRGSCYVRQEEFKSAIQCLSRVPPSPKRFKALNNAGVAFLRDGNIEEAVKTLADAKKLAPAEPKISLNVAIARHVQGNDALALGIAEEAAKTHPKSGMLHFLRGVLLATQGENDAASAAMGKAKSMGIDADKLQAADPKSWCEIYSEWE